MTNSSRLPTLIGIDLGNTCYLLNSIATVLKEELKISKGVNLGNVERSGWVQEKITRVVLIGASNLNQVAVHMRNFGVEVIDLCVPGWVINPSNVEEIKQRLEHIGAGRGTAVITDLFGNSVFKF